MKTKMWTAQQSSTNLQRRTELLRRLYYLDRVDCKKSGLLDTKGVAEALETITFEGEQHWTRSAFQDFLRAWILMETAFCRDEFLAMFPTFSVEEVTALKAVKRRMPPEIKQEEKKEEKEKEKKEKKNKNAKMRKNEGGMILKVSSSAADNFPCLGSRVSTSL